MVKITTLTIENIVSEMLADFCHHQVITKTYIHDHNEWKITDTHSLREWSLEKRNGYCNIGNNKSSEVALLLRRLMKIF